MIAHPGGFFVAFIAWTLMMSAMMLPSYVPWMRVHARVAVEDERNPVLATAQLLSGYLTAWALYSGVGAALQTWLQTQTVLGPELKLTGAAASLVLIAIGAFQFAPLKEACLSKCRNPISFLLNKSHNGKVNSYKLGLRQGAFCVGCCWALMALGFVVGVMNVWWIVMLTVLVTIEKLAARGKQIGKLAGVVLIVWGTVGI